MGFPRYFAGASTVDQTSEGGGCIYPPAPVGVAVPSATVVVGSGPLMMVLPGTPAVPVPASNLRLPIPCEPLVRTVKVKVNDFLCVEGQFPALSGGVTSLGDVCDSQYGERHLTIPFQHPKIIIGSGGTYVPPPVE